MSFHSYTQVRYRNNSLTFNIYKLQRSFCALVAASVFFLFLSEGRLNAQVKLWGLTPSGGAEQSGAIINLNTDGSNFNSIAFPSLKGENPQYTRLLKAANGKFYGMTNQGGSSGEGILYEYDPSTGTYTVRHEFADATGRNPYGSLIEYGGKFYGMTFGGGSSGGGVLFQYDPSGSGTYTVRRHFSYATGWYPEGSLIESGGKFYGLTAYGGDSDAGVLFQYDPAGGGTYTVRHHFNGTTGGRPFGSLKESGGKFYGMTHSGGNSDVGVIFRYDPSGGGTYTTLHQFNNTNGANPHGSLMESGGKFYGMTHSGGSSGLGVIFQYDPSGGGSYAVLHHYNDTNGANPRGDLMESGGKFYGMTFAGGSQGKGVIFQYDPSGGGTHTVLHHFMGNDGQGPSGSLIESGGKFYGTTNFGGGADTGVLFEYDPAGGGIYDLLLSFGSAPEGKTPYGSLIKSGGKFYGMTSDGGNEGYGVIFEYDPSGGGTRTVLHHFDLTTGGIPYGSLIKHNGKFYGMTYSGGSQGQGVIFEYDPSGGGTYSVLHNFDGTTGGGAPYGSLIAYSGKFYGMTPLGGSEGYGVLFEYDPSGGGTYTARHHFNSTTGRNPYGSLIEYNGKFYGMTSFGGLLGQGVIFEYDPSGGGAYAALYGLYGYAGANPYGSLIEVDGKFYGTTSAGGTAGYGVVFEYDPFNTNDYFVLHDFDYTNGAYPRGSLVESDGKLYGMAYSGGSGGGGVVFEVDLPEWDYTVRKHLQSGDGVQPLYGSLYADSPCDGEPSFTSCPASPVEVDTDAGECTAVVNYTVEAGGTPTPALTYAFTGATTDSGNGTGSGAMFNQGNTSVTVTATNDCGTETCVFTVTVTDNEAPSIDCPSNQALSPDNESPCSASVSGIDGTYDDNCTGASLAYEFSGATTGIGYGQASGQTFLTGITTVFYIVTDGAGLTSFCFFTVEVASCDGITISGKLIWEHDDATGVGNATVALTGDQSGSTTTPADGTYSFTVTSGADFTVTPTKTINKLNGVSAADAARIQQHAVGVNPITDLYKLVAADVNKSNSVTTQDASIISQALLGNPAALAQFKTSWRFVPTSHTMNNPPWAFPEKITLTDVQEDMPEQNFYGIKTGDVITPYTNPANFNGSATPEFVLNATDQSLQFGGQVSIIFSANQFSDLAALQFALQFDVEKLSFVGIEPLAGFPITAENFGTYNISEGAINVVWSQAEGVFVEEAAPVFRLTFNVLETGGTLSEALQLAEDVLEGHAYTSALADNKVRLHFFGTTSADDPAAQPRIELLQNRPNPFYGRTTIGFILPESCEVQLRVYDAEGRILAEKKAQYAAGRNEETFDLEGASGVLFAELLTEQGSIVRKMLALR